MDTQRNQQYQSASQQEQAQKRQGRQATKQREAEATRSPFCPHCGARINSTCELCPECGKPIDEGHCSFCGAAFEGNEPFCSECGSPRAGIKCPKCGALSFRSFCHKCNTPLNDAAQQAMAQAQADPRFQKAQKLSAEMASMESYLNMLKEEIERAIAADEAEGSGPEAPGLSAEGQQLRTRYAQLLGLLGQQPKEAPRPQAASKPSADRRRQMQVKFQDADMIMEAYRKKQAEMEQTLKSMLPDASLTPAQQRDYCCARKVATVITEKALNPTWWVCNFCGCYHRQPSECVEPWHGGTWLHEEVTIEKKVWNYIK